MKNRRFVIALLFIVILFSTQSIIYAINISEESLLEMEKYYLGAMEEIENQGFDIKDVVASDIKEEILKNAKDGGSGRLRYSKSYYDGQISIIITTNSYSVYIYGVDETISIDNYDGERIVNTIANEELSEIGKGSNMYYIYAGVVALVVGGLVLFKKCKK